MCDRIKFYMGISAVQLLCMNILERAISVLAPHECLVCEAEGSLLCQNCMHLELITIPSRCYRCHKATRQHSVCANCRRKTGLKHVWVTTEYKGAAKELVHGLKFERKQAAADVIAEWLDEQLPILPKTTVVTAVPTVNSRIRYRGYDQARLIAKAFAFKRNLLYIDLLTRVSSSRQVGAGRKDRFALMDGAFEPKNEKWIASQPVLLIDDVLTTGASVESAAKELRDSGAKSIDAVVFAH